MRKFVYGLAVLVVLAGLTSLLLPGLLDKRFNGIHPGELAPLSADAKQLHASLRIVDLHADPLLWNRDLLQRATYGHTDIPRLIEGNVGLQVFSAVTKSPRGQNYERNAGDTDRITDLVMLQRWPTATWGSLFERAQYQARKLHDFAEQSEGVLSLIQHREDLDLYLARRNNDQRITAGLLSIEGLHCLEGELQNVDRLHAAGYRMMGLTHFFDNELGGSAHGLSGEGLTQFGRDVVRRMDALGIIVDVAHASPQMITDVLDMAKRPIVVSHGGVQGTCPGPRNLSDEHVRRIGENGGVIGIGYWDAAICDVSPAGYARAARHVVDIAGIGHVALGSDFDGAVKPPFDTSGIAHITQGLMSAGFSEEQIRLIMGENALRLLRSALLHQERPR